MNKKELDGISEATYDRWADGGRAMPRRMDIDPETAAVIRKALGMNEGERPEWMSEAAWVKCVENNRKWDARNRNR